MNNEEELKRLLDGDMSQDSDASDRIERGLKRTRESLSQQQTLSFVLVKMWVVIAKVLAPFFAGMARRQAGDRAERKQSIRPKNIKYSPDGEKS